MTGEVIIRALGRVGVVLIAGFRGLFCFFVFGGGGGVGAGRVL